MSRTISFDIPNTDGSRRALNVSVAGGDRPQPILPAATFYVDAINGNDANLGTDPEQPLKTVTAALALVVSGRGDVIAVLPGSYEENVLVTKDYVTMFALVMGGYARPDFVGAAGLPLIVRAQGFVANRIRFAGTAVDSVKQEGNGFRYSDCVFDGDGTGNKAGIRLRGNDADDSFTASEGVIEDSLIRGCALGIALDSAAAPNGVGVTDNLIQRNRFYANTLDIAAKKTGLGGAYSVKTTVIQKNTFADKNKATYIDITTACDGAAGDQSGIICDNTFAADTIDTTAVKMVGTGFVFAGNRDSVGIVDGSALD